MGEMPINALSGSTPAAVDFRFYRDPEIFAAEQQRIYAGPVWNYLGFEAEVPEPGDFISTYIGTVPVVLNRSKTGVLNAWVNRCAHKGALVCRTPRGNRA